MSARVVTHQRILQHVVIALASAVLLLWTLFPFVWILLTSLKSPTDIIAVPPTFVFTPTFDNYTALVVGEQRGQYSSTRPDFPRFFLNSIIISIGAVALSVAAGIPAAYALARFNFPGKNALAFILLSFRFVPFIAFVIPLYIIYQRFGLYNTHTGLILAYQLITLPFTIWMLRSFFMEIPLEIQEAAKIDGCSWLGVLWRVILPLSAPGIAVTVILGFMFCWNAFNYPLMLAGRQTFPVTVGRHPVHLVRAGALGTDGGGDDRRCSSAALAQPHGAEVHRARADHGSREMSALKGAAPEGDASVSLLPADLRDLRRLAGFMIPASAEYGLPGADDEAIFTDIVGSLGRDQADVRHVLTMLRARAGGEFSALTDTEAEAAAMALLRQPRPEVTALGRAVLQCYYRDDRVVRSLGLDPRPPFPKGHVLEQGDWSLLDVVRSRPRMWRDVDGKGS